MVKVFEYIPVTVSLEAWIARRNWLEHHEIHYVQDNTFHGNYIVSISEEHLVHYKLAWE